MTRIIKITPVQINQVEGSLIVLETKDRYEAGNFFDTLHRVLTDGRGDFWPELQFQPPTKSFMHGDHYIVRVDRTGDLVPLLKSAIRKVAGTDPKKKEAFAVLDLPAGDEAARLEGLLKRDIQAVLEQAKAVEQAKALTPPPVPSAPAAATDTVSAWRAAINSSVPATVPAATKVKSAVMAANVVGKSIVEARPKRLLVAAAPAVPVKQPASSPSVPSASAPRSATGNLMGAVVVVNPDALRRPTVPQALTKKTFVEVLDESHKAGHRFDLFLNNLLRALGNGKDPMPSAQFYQLVMERSSNNSTKPCPNFSSGIYQWLRGKPGARPSPDTMHNIISAFVPGDNPVPDAPYLRHRHALKLYRLISGQPVDAAKTQQLIEKAQRDKSHGELFTALFEWSGVSPQEVSEWSGVPYTNLWTLRQGKRLWGHQDRMKDLMDILNPPALEIGATNDPKIVAQNKVLAGLATGRPLDLSFKDMLVRARASDDPSTTLLNMLVGPYGKVKMGDEDLASYMTKKLKRPYSSDMIQGRRLGNTQIIESEAKAIADLACLKKEQDIESCVEILTKILAPGKLLDMVEASKGSFSVGRMFELTRQRRRPKGRDSFDWGLSQDYILEFEKNPDYKLRPRSALKLADGVELTGEDRRRFILLAMGRSIIRTEDLTPQAMGPPSLRPEKLRAFFDGTGLTPATLAVRVGVQQSTMELWRQSGIVTHRDPTKIARFVAARMFLDEPGPREEFETAFQKAFTRPVP